MQAFPNPLLQVSGCPDDYFSTMHKTHFVLILNMLNINTAVKMYILIKHSLKVALRKELQRAADAP